MFTTTLGGPEQSQNLKLQASLPPEGQKSGNWVRSGGGHLVTPLWDAGMLSSSLTQCITTSSPSKSAINGTLYSELAVPENYREKNG